MSKICGDCSTPTASYGGIIPFSQQPTNANASDSFLKDAKLNGTKLVLTVGERATTANDTTYEVELSSLISPSNPNVSLSDSKLTIGDKTVDLRSAFSNMPTDMPLKDAKLDGTKLVLTVGKPDTTDSDKKFEVELSNLANTLNPNVSLSDSKLTIGDKTVDLRSAFSNMPTDMPLKSAKLEGTKLVLTVGERDTTANDKTFEVELSSLVTPSNLDVSLNGSMLNIGGKTVDLHNAFPNMSADFFLKNAQRVDNKIVLTVGERDTAANDKIFEIDLSDFANAANPDVSLNESLLVIGDKVVDLQSAFPNMSVDFFLKDAKLDGTKLVLTVGERNTTDNDNKFEIDLSSLATVSSPNVSINGSVLTIGDKTVDLREALPSSGLDLSNIPEKEFITGSKVIAFDPQGNLYKFGQQSDYFKDVAISLNKVSSELQEDGSTKHLIEVTVTNTREQAVPTTTVHMSSQNPINDFSLTTNDATNVEQKGNDIVITNLASYGVVRYTVTVVNSYNDYFSATAEADGDVVSSNNSATLTLTLTPRPIEKQNVYTRECPLLTANIGEQSLSQSKQVETPSADAKISYAPAFINLIDNTTLSGVTVQIPKSHSVRVFLSNEGALDDYQNFNGIAFVKELEKNKYNSWAFNYERLQEATDADYTYANGVLTFSTSAKQAIIYARPSGADCLWQVYMIGTFNATTTITEQTNRISVTGLDNAFYEYKVKGSEFGGDNFKNLPPVEAVDDVETNKQDVRVISRAHFPWDAEKYAKHYLKDATVNVANKLVIRLPKGAEFNFAIGKKDVLPEQQGNVTTTAAGTVKVSSNASETDSVYTDLVDIIIYESNDSAV